MRAAVTRLREQVREAANLQVTAVLTIGTRGHHRSLDGVGRLKPAARPAWVGGGIRWIVRSSAWSPPHVYRATGPLMTFSLLLHQDSATDMRLM
jgi:hypothetical protein